MKKYTVYCNGQIVTDSTSYGRATMEALRLEKQGHDVFILVGDDIIPREHWEE